MAFMPASHRPILNALGALFLLLMLLAGGTLAAQGGGDGSFFATPMPLPDLIGPLLAGNAPDNAGLFLYDLATGQQRNLAFGRGRHWFGSFAPDGCRFAFVMEDPHGAPGGGPGSAALRLYTARIDGADLRELVSFTDDSGALDWEAWSPQWSPDGVHIAFILIRDYERSGERERTTHIAWVPPEGGAPGFYSVSGTEGDPVWSPNGQWLAYTSYEIGAAGQRENDLWIVSADGGTKYPITDFAAGSTLFPRWSPGGDVISFIYAPTGNNHQFWTTPASGGTVQQWSGAETLVLAYDWLVDGSGLVAAIKGWQGHDDNLLWRVPLPGWADTDSTLYLANPEATAVDYPDFSPDGRYLAFRSAYSAMLYTMDTGDLRELTGVGLNNTPLTWSPAGFTGEANCP
jgi:Tol biopolymer transport system component